MNAHSLAPLWLIACLVAVAALLSSCSFGLNFDDLQPCPDNSVLDEASGECVCQPPFVDNGRSGADQRCGCPAGSQEADGACVCEGDNRVFDEASGACVCGPTFLTNPAGVCVCETGLVERDGVCDCPEDAPRAADGTCVCDPSLGLTWDPAAGACLCVRDDHVVDATTGACGCPGATVESQPGSTESVCTCPSTLAILGLDGGGVDLDGDPSSCEARLQYVERLTEGGNILVDVAVVETEPGASWMVAVLERGAASITVLQYELTLQGDGSIATAQVAEGSVTLDERSPVLEGETFTDPVAIALIDIEGTFQPLVVRGVGAPTALQRDGDRLVTASVSFDSQLGFDPALFEIVRATGWNGAGDSAVLLIGLYTDFEDPTGPVLEWRSGAISFASGAQADEIVASGDLNAIDEIPVLEFDLLADCQAQGLVACADGTCGPASSTWCNGVPDCADGSDEWPTRCIQRRADGALRLYCGGQALTLAQVCDGTPDCSPDTNGVVADEAPGLCHCWNQQAGQVPCDDTAAPSSCFDYDTGWCDEVLECPTTARDAGTGDKLCELTVNDLQLGAIRPVLNATNRYLTAGRVDTYVSEGTRFYLPGEFGRSLVLGLEYTPDSNALVTIISDPIPVAGVRLDDDQTLLEFIQTEAASHVLNALRGLMLPSNALPIGPDDVSLSISAVTGVGTDVLAVATPKVRVCFGEEDGMPVRVACTPESTVNTGVDVPVPSIAVPFVRTVDSITPDPVRINPRFDMALAEALAPTRAAVRRFETIDPTSFGLSETRSILATTFELIGTDGGPTGEYVLGVHDVTDDQAVDTLVLYEFTAPQGTDFLGPRFFVQSPFIFIETSVGLRVVALLPTDE